MEIVGFSQMGILNNDFSLLATGLEVRHILLSLNVIYYIIDGNEFVVTAILHSRQSPDTIREVITLFFEAI